VALNCVWKCILISSNISAIEGEFWEPQLGSMNPITGGPVIITSYGLYSFRTGMSTGDNGTLVVTGNSTVSSRTVLQYDAYYGTFYNLVDYVFLLEMEVTLPYGYYFVCLTTDQFPGYLASTSGKNSRGKDTLNNNTYWNVPIDGYDWINPGSLEYPESYSLGLIGDNCAGSGVYDPTQRDTDHNGVGDVCQCLTESKSSIPGNLVACYKVAQINEANTWKGKSAPRGSWIKVNVPVQSYETFQPGSYTPLSENSWLNCDCVPIPLQNLPLP